MESIFPKAVRQAEIPKKDGTKRLLGIPTVTDRVAQTVIKWKLEKYSMGISVQIHLVTSKAKASMML